MIRLVVVLAAIFATAIPAAGQGDPIAIAEWAVPWQNTRPRDPFAHAGRVWFVGQRADYVATLDPATGAFRKLDLPRGAGPHNVVVSGDVVWYAGNGDGTIGRIEPRTGEIETFPAGVRDPHTLEPAPDGSIWFTAQMGNAIGRIDPATREVSLARVSTPDARPYGIVFAGGKAWVTLFGTHKLAAVDPATMTVEEFDLPRTDARPRRLDVGADGMVWYVDYAGGRLGRLDPRTREVEEWTTPGGPSSRPYALALDGSGRPWFAETGSTPNRIVGFDPETRMFFGAATVPSGGGVVRHMTWDATNGTLWFGTDAGTIARAVPPRRAIRLN